jgi:hypothetical protein
MLGDVPFSTFRRRGLPLWFSLCRAVAGGVRGSQRDSLDRSKDYMILNVLAVAEIGSSGILLAGFFLRLYGLTGCLPAMHV